MDTLRFPFELPEGRDIAFEESLNFQCDGYEMSLRRDGRFFVMVISGFQGEAQAREYIANVRSGLTWLLLNRGLAVAAAYEVQPITISEDPEAAANNLSRSLGGVGFGSEIHGLFDGSRPAVFPTDGNFRQLTAGKVSITQSTSGADALDFLRKGMSVRVPQILMTDQKLQTALELYGAFYTENSDRARFISLVMALEALAVARPRHQIVRDFLESVGGMIDEKLRGIEDSTEEAIAFKSLKKELDYRHSDSIRSSIRELVIQTLQCDPDVHDVSARALQAYDKRSKLVHDGYLPQQELAEAIDTARTIVRRVLIRKFVDETGFENDTESVPNPST